MLTLAQCQTGQFQTASGYCTNTQPFLELLNDVVDQYMARGDWDCTLMPVRVCIVNGCVTWPRYVGQVRKINMCRGNATVQNVWYNFLENNNGSRGIYGWNAWCGEERKMTAQYRTPTYNDIYGPNLYVRLYPMVPDDVGSVVTVFGTDNNGQPLVTNNGNGTWSQGINITLALPFGSSSIPVSTITRVAKPVTQGTVNMFAYDAIQNVLFDLAVYEPSETNPNYLRYQLEGAWNQPNGQTSCCQGQCPQSVIALVKLQQLPIASPTDLVIINNRRALLMGIRAMKLEDANSFAEADKCWQRGIEALNRQLEDANPDEQFSSANNTFGRMSFRNQAF